MKNIVRIALVAVSLAGGSVALAKDSKPKAEANCEVKGKKSHVKDEAACKAKKGTWLAPAAAAPAAAKDAPATEAAPAATDSATPAPTK